MSPNDPTRDDALREQLSAWMDGELPADEARFLERRLSHDPVLVAQWERWQLASACLRGQPPAPTMDVAAGVAAALARPAPARHGWRWAAGLAAALALGALLPGLGGRETSPVLPAAPTVAERAAPGTPVPREGLAIVARPAAASPAPATTPSVADALAAKPWPRSPLAPEPAALAPYVARHSAVAGQAGLGGFMPYVDVVAPSPDEAPDPADGEPRR